MKKLRSVPQLHHGSPEKDKEASPQLDVGIVPSKAEVILAKALDDRGIDYSAEASGQKINFILPDRSVCARISETLRVSPGMVAASLDAEALDLMAQNYRVVDVFEGDVIGNIDFAINQILSAYT